MYTTALIEHIRLTYNSGGWEGKTFQQAQTKSSSKIIRSIVTRNQVLPGLVSVISPSLCSVLSGRCKYISRCVYACGPGRPTSSSLCSPARLLPVTFTSTKIPHGPSRGTASRWLTGGARLGPLILPRQPSRAKRRLASDPLTRQPGLCPVARSAEMRSGRMQPSADIP